MIMGRANESIDSWRGTAAQRRGALFLAGGFALGIAIGWVQPWSIVWPWLGLAAAALAAALRWRARAAASLPCIAIASIGLGVAWVTLRQHYVEPNDLAAMVSDEPVLVRLRGELLRSPQIRDRAAGSLGLFDYRGPVTYFPLRVEALLPRSGAEQAVRGRVLVRVDEPLNMLRAGDEVEAMGFLARPREPHNPGEFNYARYAATLGQAGILVVESRENLRILTADAPSWWARLRQWHEQLQRRASGWLLADLPASRSSAADGLLADLLLGQRDLQIESVEESFRRVGLSHLLAISGAHMAVLAGVVLLVLRLGGQPRRWHALVVIAAVVIYMLLIEVRVPVLRSAIMIVTACIGQLFSRRLSAAGLLELSAVLVLLWRPDQLFDAGFQLSYAAVLGLIYLSPIVRERLFGPHDNLAATTGSMLRQWLFTACAASITAWALVTPLQIHHFGTISPLAAPLTVLLVPVVSLLLVVGYLKMLLAVLLPSAGLLVGTGLTRLAEALAWLVQQADALPGASIDVPFASTTWTTVAMLWVSAWAGATSRWRRCAWLAAGVGLAAGLLWPWLPLHRPALRIDMLSVNNGSCFVLRSGGETVIFDAGSSPDLDVGRKTIVPALRRLGVRSINAILISHADMDHYASVLELVDAFGRPTVRVTPQFLAAASDDPHGPVALLLAQLADRGIEVKLISAGDFVTFGAVQATCLHPSALARFTRHNDASLVVRVEAAGRSLLLCGDVLREAMAMLMTSLPELRADCVELPHHGSYNDVAQDFVARLDPAIILQSTGAQRIERDRWSEPLADRARLITARGGACWVEIDHEGTMQWGRFIDRSATTGE